MLLLYVVYSLCRIFVMINKTGVVNEIPSEVKANAPCEKEDQRQ